MTCEISGKAKVITERGCYMEKKGWCKRTAVTRSTQGGGTGWGDRVGSILTLTEPAESRSTFPGLMSINQQWRMRITKSHHSFSRQHLRWRECACNIESSLPLGQLLPQPNASVRAKIDRPHTPSGSASIYRSALIHSFHPRSSSMPHS